MQERSYANDELSYKRSQPLPPLASRLSSEGQGAAAGLRRRPQTSQHQGRSRDTAEAVENRLHSRQVVHQHHGPRAVGSGVAKILR
jgi:hypothetical protein